MVAADMLKLKRPPGAPFDLVYCRLFLMHMLDPVAALEKMASWVKRGILAAQEFDFGAIGIEPPCPAMAEFNRMFEGVFRGHGRNLRQGANSLPSSRRRGSASPTATRRPPNSSPSRTWRKC